MESETRETRFYREYQEELTNEVREYPERFAYGVEMVPVVVARMIRALMRGSATIQDSKALRRTCKTLGVKFTQTRIANWLNGTETPAKRARE